jgi:SAM-dependent methyltransferase
MKEAKRKDVWASGDAYEPYVGRWSRLVASQFLQWLAIPAGCDWLDVGCGTGALTQTVLKEAAPRRVVGVDPSAGFVAHAAAHITDPRATFRLGDAQALPVGPDEFDVSIAGLVINFVPDRRMAVAEMARRPDNLKDLFSKAGLERISIQPVDAATIFKDFDDYWTPFLGGQGPAPGYCMSLSEDDRAALRERIRESLPVGNDGSIHLIARAWAVRGVR